MRTILMADFMTPDENEVGKWDIMEWTEKEAKDRVARWDKGNLGKQRVYEFKDGNIQEVDRHDFDKYLIKLNNSK